jgi:hypothetical protein
VERHEPRPTLDAALAYQNQEIVDRFLDDWDVAPVEAQQLFDDVKRFLYLQAVCGREVPMSATIGMIDEMWHNFALFTVEYAAYCDSVYGRFLHHAPTSHGAPPTPEQMVAEFRRLRELVLANLGVETLLRWFVDYPQRFDDAFLARGYKPKRQLWKPDAELLAIAAKIRAARGEG